MESKVRPHVAIEYPEFLTLGFDPLTSEDVSTRAIFSRACLDTIAVTLYLLWRYNHLTSKEFPAEVIRIAIRIRELKPTNAETLKLCFRGASRLDFSPGDVETFCESAIPYFTGEKTISYQVKVPQSS